jgi:acetyl esterase
MADEPHPEVQEVLALVEALDMPETHELDPPAAREQFAARTTQGGPAAEVAAVEDRTLPGPDGPLDARVYTPAGDGPHPVLAFFHGGGFVLGSPDTHDDLARALCAEAGRVVVSVDYRLAPEHPFPAAVHDAYHATAWLSAHAEKVDGDPGRVAVAGDSAGGTLAAVVSLLARDRRRGEAALPEALPDPPDVERQVLFYPATRYGVERADRDEEYLLTAADQRYFRERYLRDPLEGYNPYAYPMAARDLADLPPATVVTAGFDPLADEGAAYAERLADDGVAVAHHGYDAMVHGFASMLTEPGRVERSWDAVRAVADDL